MGAVTVYAWRGPLVGQRVDIEEADVEAATADDGWAQKLEPGTVLKTDPSATLDPKWKIPGVESPTAEVEVVEAKPGKGDENGDDDDGEDESRPSPTSTRGRPRKPR